MCSGVDQPVFRHIDWSAKDVAAGIADHRRIGRHFREAMPLRTEDRVVRRVMHIGCAAAALNRRRDVAVVAILAAACGVRLAKTASFLLSFLGPRSGQQVVGVSIARQEIHRDHAELQ